MPRRDKKIVNRHRKNKQIEQTKTNNFIKVKKTKKHRKLNNKQQGSNQKPEINASAPEGLAVLLHMWNIPCQSG